MKEVVVISGKGGTGKTTVTANLAALANQFVLADCDVDAPNLHILLNPKILEEKPFYGGNVVVRHSDRCIDCGLCRVLCEFEAIAADGEIDPIKCEGCNLCAVKCPMGALTRVPQHSGTLYFSETDRAPMVHARLKAGGENSGKLVTQIKRIAAQVAKEYGCEWAIVDGSPGIGCPTIASVRGADAALIVTEPTVSGLADLKRVVQLVEQFRVRAFVIINKFDLNLTVTEEIEAFCGDRDIVVLGRLPLTQAVVEALRRGELLVRQGRPNPVGDELNAIWNQLNAYLS
ncbi:(4Fe-4S)-binding protein [Leptolyngbya valderiana BDU 20041]|nr:(4Fe-4S)-binding protein [Leptolyngbya valderiana BDU 20041]